MPANPPADVKSSALPAAAPTDIKGRDEKSITEKFLNAIYSDNDKDRKLCIDEILKNHLYSSLLIKVYDKKYLAIFSLLRNYYCIHPKTNDHYTSTKYLLHKMLQVAPYTQIESLNPVSNDYTWRFRIIKEKYGHADFIDYAWYMHKKHYKPDRLAIFQQIIDIINNRAATDEELLKAIDDGIEKTKSFFRSETNANILRGLKLTLPEPTKAKPTVALQKLREQYEMFQKFKAACPTYFRDLDTALKKAADAKNERLKKLESAQRLSEYAAERSFAVDGRRSKEDTLVGVELTGSPLHTLAPQPAPGSAAPATAAPLPTQNLS